MATTKKTTTKKGSTSKGNTSSKKGKSNTKAKTSSDKSKKKSSYVSSSTGKKVPFSEQHYNAIMLGYLIAAGVMAAFIFIKGANIWTSIRSVFFSVFGVSFYMLAFQMLYMGIRLALHNLKRSLLITNISGFVLCGSFAGIVHLIMNKADAFGWTSQLSETAKIAWAYGQGELSFTGGIIGAIFGGGPLFACGKGGAVVLVLVLFIGAAFLHLGIETESIGDSVSVAINGGKQKLDESAENIKARKVERQRLKAERAVMLETEKREAESKITDTNGDTFDFNSTEIELDMDPNTDRETGLPLREVKRYFPEEKVFSYDEKTTISSDANSTIRLSAFDFISGDAPKPRMPRKNTPPSENSGSFISGNTPEKTVPVAEKPKAVEVKPKAEVAENDEDDIIKKAVAEADESLKKNLDDVENYKQEKKKRDYVLPPIECLNQPEFSSSEGFANEMQTTSKKLVEVLSSFGVETKLVGISRGPSVTRYELSPAPGVKISKITNLADDIALGLASSGVRIEAPIPNKSAVGIEVPNRSRSTVTLREIISSAEYKKNADKLLTVALGKDITGNVNCADLSKMPHLLIAGTTGSGKSVCLNCMITSILYNATPSQVKLLMIDPKQVEFTVYNGIPHLLVPVITDARKAAGSLAWAVSEMDNRYKAFSNCGVRDIGGFNKYVQSHPEIEPMPQIVIFIDELNDLMMVSPKEVEDSICRLAQKARAAGMHLVVATQRPSVDVITGVIKANIPSRLSLSVSSQVDSRTILDCIGAENLLGNGDMLFSPVGITKPVRIQGAYLSDEEIERIVTFIKAQENAEYDDEIMSEIERNAAADNSGKKKSGGGVSVGDEGGNYDALIEDAMDLITLADIASTTAIQRKLGVGYARAGRIMDQLEELGFVSAAEGNKPRKVLVSRAQYLEMKAAGNEPETSADEEYDIFSD